ncbi:hypothetical protein IWQ60_008830 [Tieghemiomyces parasiticus]|uniref:Uncharacterized protein n=1 Tax=Tieghemiomyces parasiticus TaxID=78921 RepID=A0A9W7ZV38_9FUNG|nr:hypothetical protein IWQ60_008830 [Tieghemiomyces parasiticus]
MTFSIVSSVNLDRQATTDSGLQSRKLITLSSPFSLLSFEWDCVQLAVTEFSNSGKVGSDGVSFQIDVYDTMQGFSFTRTWSEFHWLNYKLRQYQSVNKLTLPILSETNRNAPIIPKNLFFLKSNAEKVEKYVRKVLAEPFLRCTPELFEFMSPKRNLAATATTKPAPIKIKTLASANRQSSPTTPKAKADIPIVTPTNATASPLKYGKSLLKIDTATIQANLTTPLVKPTATKAVNFTVACPTINEETHIASVATSASLENFDLIRVVGRGCMGKVFLARDKTTNELVAIKSISKEKVLKQNEVDHILGERNILADIADSHHPYLMKLHYSFQTEGHLFLVLDYLPGGDIATQLARHYRFTEERTRFYAAQIVLGLEQLHRMGIVYRDLKPENMLIDRQGHVLLTDFGLSKQMPSEGFNVDGRPAYRRRTKTFCGTAEYLAPEMLRGESYDSGIDYWSLGTCLYEMLTGMTPFWADNHSKMYQRVLFDRLQFPANVSWEARNLITGLLAKDPQRRLGAGEFGLEQIKAHPFFATVDWSAFLSRQVAAPYVPPITHAEDVSNFEDTFIRMPVELAATNRDYLLEYYRTHGCYDDNHGGSQGAFRNPFARYDYVARHHHHLMPLSATRIPQTQHPVTPSRASRAAAKTAATALLSGMVISPIQSQPPQDYYGNNHGNGAGDGMDRFMFPSYQDAQAEFVGNPNAFYRNINQGTVEQLGKIQRIKNLAPRDDTVIEESSAPATAAVVTL